MPSTIAELGYVIERHLQSIGLLKKPELDVHQRKLGPGKARGIRGPGPSKPIAFSKSHFSRRARSCAPKCSTRRSGDAGWLYHLFELRRLQVWVAVGE